VLPPKGAYVNVHAELMTYFARNLWRKLWDSISMEIASQCDTAAADGNDECRIDERLDALDMTGDGIISVEEIQVALRDRLGYSVDDREMTLAQFVHSFADMTGDGQVTRKDLKLFCDDLDDLYKQDQWRLGFKKPSDEKATAQIH
jgi:hypothetical protein